MAEYLQTALRKKLSTLYDLKLCNIFLNGLQSSQEFGDFLVHHRKGHKFSYKKFFYLNNEQKVLKT